MSYTFINGPLSIYRFEPYWFNTPAYLTKATIDLVRQFSFNEDSKSGFINFYSLKEGSEWISSLRAPFGGVEFSDDTDLTILYNFLKEIIAVAKSEGVRKIKIIQPPECYEINKADLVDEVFVHLGFKVQTTELNYHIHTSQGDFEHLIASPEKRKISKCIEAGFNCFEDATPNYKEVYQLIIDCRKRKGFPISMNLENFEKMFTDFPDRYKLFVVKDGSILIAAAVGVIVSTRIIYNFLGSDHQDYLAYSPTVWLNKVMYEYSRANGYEIYDLGIGTANGIRNEGLIKFKEHIGGTLSHKYTYEIIIE